jgi:hypothetical protein
VKNLISTENFGHNGSRKLLSVIIVVNNADLVSGVRWPLIEIHMRPVESCSLGGPSNVGSNIKKP